MAKHWDGFWATIPPGYQFEPCGIPGFDPAMTFDPCSIPGVDPALIFQMPENPETLETQEPTFELLLMLIHSPKYLCTPNWRTRNPKPELENIGPFDVSVNIGWDAFLETVAEKICIQCLDLPISTFEWHWLKPASGLWLPIWDENGFASMVKKIKKIKLKSEAYVCWSVVR